MTGSKSGQWPSAPPSVPYLISVIRRLALDSRNVFFSTHALDRLDERGLTDAAVITGFKIGDIEGNVEPGQRTNEWKCVVVFPDPDLDQRREVAAVTILIDERELYVKTVMWRTR